MSHPRITFDMRPWRLSGIVYGTLLNDAAALNALGDVVHQPPYKAPPQAPVLYLKPRNTLAATGSSVTLPADAEAFEIGASLGLVIGRTACRLAESEALSCLAGYTLVADLSVPHGSFYRPSIRFKARDGTCLIGPAVIERSQIADPAAVPLQVSIDGRRVQSASQAGMRRSAARLLADVTDFMTLQPGDVLLLGVAAGAPWVRAGQRFSVEAEGFGRLEGAVVAPHAGATA